jgi:hypothetical protein
LELGWSPRTGRDFSIGELIVAAQADWQEGEREERGQGSILDKNELKDRMRGMARSIRIEYGGAFYHVMARGNRRERIFFDDEDRRFFCQT